MATFAAILIVPWLLALVLTPWVIRVAQARGYLDYPTARKAHKQPVAMFGGVAVFASIALGLLALAPFVPPVREALLGARVARCARAGHRADGRARRL